MRLKLLFFVATIHLLGCTDDANILFQINMETDFSIAPGLNTFETFIFPVSRVPTNIDAFIVNTDPSDIEGIYPMRATLTAPFVNFDWSIVRLVSVHAISTTDPDLQKEIFYQDQISLNEQNELRLFSSSTEVKDLLLDQSINIEIRFNFRNITPAEIPSRINMSFFADGTE